MEHRKTAVYYRVSSGQQDFDSQSGATMSQLQSVPLNELLIYQDHNVSANKIDLKNRPGIQQLLKDVENGLISKVYVYGRDRFARDPYEWDEIRRTLLKKGIEIVFTGSKSDQLQSEPIETLLGLVSFLEGQAIKRRIQDSQKQYPNKLYGYTKVDRKIYEIDEAKAQEVRDLFSRFSKAETFEQMITVVKHYSTCLKRKDRRVVAMLRTAFYAGLLDRNGTFTPLAHAPAIISREMFNHVQEKLDVMEIEIIRLKLMVPPVLVAPTCGMCGQAMLLENEVLPDDFFTCSKHKKICVSSNELNDQIAQLVKTKVSQLNIQQLTFDIKQSLQKYKQLIRQEYKNLSQKMDDLANKLVAEHFPGEHSEQLKYRLSHYSELGNTIDELLERDIQIKDMSKEVSALAELIAGRLDEKLTQRDILQMMTRALVKNVKVYSDHAEIELSFSDYFLEEGA